MNCSQIGKALKKSKSVIIESAINASANGKQSIKCASENQQKIKQQKKKQNLLFSIGTLFQYLILHFKYHMNQSLT